MAPSAMLSLLQMISFHHIVIGLVLYEVSVGCHILVCGLRRPFAVFGLTEYLSVLLAS